MYSDAVFKDSLNNKCEGLGSLQLEWEEDSLHLCPWGGEEILAVDFNLLTLPIILSKHVYLMANCN